MLSPDDLSSIDRDHWCGLLLMGRQEITSNHQSPTTSAPDADRFTTEQARRTSLRPSQRRYAPVSTSSSSQIRSTFTVRIPPGGYGL